MITRMRWRRFIATVMTICVLSLTSAAHAGLEDEEEILHDGRTEGYAQKVQVPKASTSLVWLAFMALSVISISAMFKDAKRGHLD
jgi:hypothetical protein